MKPAAALDLSHRLLHYLGWSVGEGRFKLPNGSRYWQVDASPDGQVVMGRGRTPQGVDLVSAALRWF